MEFFLLQLPYLFSTSLAATWYHQGSDGKWAVAIYCAIWVYISLMYVIILRHLRGHEHLAVNVSRISLKAILRKSYVGVCVYLLATLLSFIVPVIAFLLCLSFITYYVGVNHKVVTA